MANKWEFSLPPPMQGVFMDFAGSPRLIPPGGAASLKNFHLYSGYIRSRHGSAALFSSANSSAVLDLHNVAFGDGTVEILRHDKARTWRSTGTAWAELPGGPHWTGDDFQRFWAVLAPFFTDTKGRILINNGKDAIRTWDGTSFTSLGANAVPAKFAIMADDARLITAVTVESGTTRMQRVRWTIIGLTQSDHTNWSNTGSGAIDLRNDPWRITGLWRQGGRIYVGKERAICVLGPTGIQTDAYGFETLLSNGEGLFAPWSLIQFGELVGMLSHRTINVFDGRQPRDIMGDRNRRTLFSRLNYAALEQVTSIVDAEQNRIGWGFPMDGASYPTEIWWWDIQKDAWEVDTIGHTALSIFTGVDITTIDELNPTGPPAGQIDSLTGTIDGLSLSSSPRAQVIIGKNTGATLLADHVTFTDNGSGIISEYITPALIVRGANVTKGGAQHAVNEDDYLVADAVALTLLDLGYNYTLQVDVSGNGATWTPFGTVTVTSAGGTEANPLTVRKRVDGRIGVEAQIQVRITNITTGVPWGLIDVTPKVDLVGRIK